MFLDDSPIVALLCDFGFLSPECFQGNNTHAMAPGLLSRSVHSCIHHPSDGCFDRHYDYYLVVLRHPLKRLQSWFTYERPVGVNQPSFAGIGRYKREKQLYLECDFHTLNELGEKGLSNQTQDFSATPLPQKLTRTEEMLFNSDEYASVCQFRASMAIQGKVGYASHNKYNFRHYLDLIESKHGPKPTLAAIRTEHLEKDWKSLEEDLLHGQKNLNVSFGHMNKSKKDAKDEYLSPTALRNICRELCGEIQVYKVLLQRAVNLNDDDYATSLAELAESCPEEVKASDC